MSDLQVAVNPFGMMINPEAILDAMNRSDRLDRLQRRIYRPLDKPMIPRNGEGEADYDIARADAAIDSEPEDLGVSMGNDMADVIAIDRPMLAY